MEKRRKLVSKEKDRLMISKRITRSSSKSMKMLEQIPVELIIQILSKLCVKSIARLRCVSKYLNSILRSPEFTNLFLEVSSSRPRLLFGVQTKGKWFIYSTPKPLNPDKNSTPLTADYMCSLLIQSLFLLGNVNGLLCIASITFERGCNDSKVLIYNPSTRQSIQLPIKRGRRDYAVTYLGYDPINQQYKVLCLSMRRQLVFGYEVLTLGTEKPAWKMIECSLPRHYPFASICINGVLYYLGSLDKRVILVCFDVSSEKLNFIEIDNNKVGVSSKLINYKGQLSVLPCFFCTGETTSLELLVLDDVVKNEWSQHIFVFPPMLKDLVLDMRTRLYIDGMTSDCEFVLSQHVYDPFYIIFYNVEKNTIARVRIKGMEPSGGYHYIQTFIDHVENVKLI